MAKRIALPLVVVVVALLGASALFAEVSSPASAEAFLTSLQAPTAAPAPDLPILPGFTPEPVLRSCVSQCMSCGVNKVKLCTDCNGVVSCGTCHSGTSCGI